MLQARVRWRLFGDPERALRDSGGELEDTAPGPGGQEAEEVPEVRPGLDVVELAAVAAGDDARRGVAVVPVVAVVVQLGRQRGSAAPYGTLGR